MEAAASTFNIGYKAITAFVRAQNPLEWYKAKLSLDLFKGAEIEIFSWTANHLQQYHSLPQVETLLSKFPELKSIDVPEPVKYYSDLLERRFRYDTLNNANLESQQILINDKTAVDAAEDVLHKAIERITQQQYRSRIMDVGKEAGKLVMTQYHQQSLTEALAEFGWPYMDNMAGGLLPGDVISIVGRPACLSGDTKIWVSRKKDSSGRAYTLKQLHDRFNGGEIPCGVNASRIRKWDLSIDTQVNSMNSEGFTQLNSVHQVVYSGKKVTYTVTTDSGKSLRATVDHRFRVPNGDSEGFKKLSEISVGDFVACRGVKIKYPYKAEARQTKECCTKLPYSPYRTRVISGQTYHRVSLPRLNYDAKLNKLTTEDFLQGLKTNPTHDFIFSNEKYHVHHKDGNWENNNPENLECLSPKDHAHEHSLSSDFGRRCGGREVVYEKVSAIELYGEEDTYDISMAGPHHNFVANDFVVHNSGKTWLTLYVALKNWLKGRTVLFVSMEMSPLAIAQRLSSMYAGTPISYLKMATFSTAYLAMFTDAMLKMAKQPGKLYVVDGNLAASPSDVYLLADQLHADMVVVDGAYLMRNENNRLDRFQRVTANVEAMKYQSSDLGVATFASWQLNRDAAKKAKQTGPKKEAPDLEDIALSDAIGQISSVVLALMQSEGVETMYKRHVDVLKGRNGEVGGFPINWEFTKMNFDQITEENHSMNPDWM